MEVHRQSSRIFTAVHEENKRTLERTLPPLKIPYKMLPHFERIPGTRAPSVHVCVSGLYAMSVYIVFGMCLCMPCLGVSVCLSLEHGCTCAWYVSVYAVSGCVFVRVRACVPTTLFPQPICNRC